MRRRVLFLLVTLVMLCSLGGCGSLRTPEAGECRIEDKAGLLSNPAKERLLAQMEGLKEYGNIFVATVEENSTHAEVYARSLYTAYFGDQSGLLFLIDMGNREIYLYVDGYIGDNISTAKARQITGKIYKLASAGKYEKCASEALRYCKLTLEGGTFLSGMKIASNAALAILIGVVINFIVLLSLNRKREVTNIDYRYSNTGKTKFLNQKVDILSKTTRVIESSSGHGGGSRGGFGGGGGRGHGGGHRF